MMCSDARAPPYELLANWVKRNVRPLPGKTVDDVVKYLQDRILAAREIRLEDSERDLAECYRLSGADPDDNEDWRLAPRAVEEVRRMRQESDELAAENERLRRERDKAIKALKWAKRELVDACSQGEGEEEMYVPGHPCDYQYQPDLGHCDFHAGWGDMVDIIATHEAREAMKRARGD